MLAPFSRFPLYFKTFMRPKLAQRLLVEYQKRELDSSDASASKRRPQPVFAQVHRYGKTGS